MRNKWCIYLLLWGCCAVEPNSALAQRDSVLLDSVAGLSSFEQLFFARDFEASANSHLETFALKRAEANFVNAYLLFFANNQFMDAGRVKLRLAYIYQQVGLPQKAESSFKEAIALFRTMESADMELESLNLLVGHVFQLQDWKRFELYAALLWKKSTELNKPLPKAELLLLRAQRALPDSLELALRYFQQADSLLHPDQHPRTKAEAQLGMANCWVRLNQWERARRAFLQANLAYRHLGLFDKEARCSFRWGSMEIEQGNLARAEELLMKSYSISLTFRYWPELVLATERIAHLKYLQNKLFDALRYHRVFVAYDDSAKRIETQRNVRLTREKYDITNYEENLNLQQTDISLQQQAYSQAVWRNRVLIVLLISVLTGMVFLYSVSRKRLSSNMRVQRINTQIEGSNQRIAAQQHQLELLEQYLLEQHEEMVSQRDLLIQQRDYAHQQREYIQQQQAMLAQNMLMARRLQESLQPSLRKCESLLGDYFIINIPQQHVSGDFFWIKKLDSNRLVCLVADSTGHGVPGALMSVLGITAINDLVSEKPLKTATELLERMRKRTKASLRNAHGSTEKDGYDVAVCILSRQDLTLQYAGALSPLYHVRNGELTVLKPDRFPVGSHLSFEKSFAEQQLNLLPGDCIYLLTDGMKDQFGGVDGKKMGSKRLQHFLAQNAHLPSAQQQDLLNHYFQQWKADYEQTDDVLLMGIRI